MVPTDTTFQIPSGEVIAREMQVAYLNVSGPNSPDWAPLGCRTTGSVAEYDWKRESAIDILGYIRISMKKPIITQNFDPLPLDGGDKAIKKLYQLAIVEQNPAGLCNLDMLLVHYYTTVNGKGGNFAERYTSSSVEVKGLGGEGGGHINMPITVTYGGKRELGSALKIGSTVFYSSLDKGAFVTKKKNFFLDKNNRIVIA